MRVASRWGLGKDGGGLAKAGGHFDQPGAAFGIECEPPLIVERLEPFGICGVAGRCGEELVEGHLACRFLGLPLSFSCGVGHPRGYPKDFSAGQAFPALSPRTGGLVAAGEESWGEITPVFRCENNGKPAGIRTLGDQRG